MSAWGSQSNSVKGKRIVVTGASSGIGYATAELLVQEGAQVLGLCRGVENLPAGVEPLACDLTKPEQIKAAFAEVGQQGQGLDALVNSAGLAMLSHIDEGDPADWQRMWQINVQGLGICCQQALELFPDTGGQIINISSISGHRVPPTGGFYAPTKFALRGMSEALRLELRSKENPTRVSTVSPGFVETPLLNTYFKGREKQLSEARNQQMMLNPLEVSQTVLYILLAPSRVEVGDISLRAVGQTV